MYVGCPLDVYVFRRPVKKRCNAQTNDIPPKKEADFAKLL